MIDTRSCSNLTEEIDLLLKDGYRLDMIMPADAPREALLSKNGHQLRVTTNPKSKIENLKSAGRAGMVYRDLIPDRLNGRVIASHIRINEGGPVPDYVHYHKIRFQMIYCKAGWVRVVYEDQGEPFVMNAGDCVLQPPEIRHRVLEASAGAEVIEIGTPAEHETWVDHDIQLPTLEVNPDRNFGGQRFVRHVRSEATWNPVGDSCRVMDTQIEQATDGYARVRTLGITSNGIAERNAEGDLLFLYILSGAVREEPTGVTRRMDDHRVITDGSGYRLSALEDSEILEVHLPAI